MKKKICFIVCLIFLMNFNSNFVFAVINSSDLNDEIQNNKTGETQIEGNIVDSKKDEVPKETTTIDSKETEETKEESNTNSKDNLELKENTTVNSKESVEEDNTESDKKELVTQKETESEQTLNVNQKQVEKNTINNIETTESIKTENLQQQIQTLEIKEEAKQTIQNGTYIISSAMNSNLVLDITGNSTVAGANVEIWEKNNQNNQKFNVTFLGDGYYKLEVVSSGKYLSGTNSNPKKEDNVIQNTYQDKDIQKWIIKDAGNGYYYIISKAGLLYLDIYGAKSTNGTNVELYTKNQGSNQKFKFNKVDVVSGTQSIQNGTYTISTSMNFNQVIDVHGASTANNANVEIFQRNGGQNQKYKLEYLGDGYYKIQATHSGKVLTVKNSDINKGANVDQENYIGIDSQKWVIKSAGGSYYYIISKCNGLYLDLQGGVSNSGTNLEVYTPNYKNWQKFKFDSIEIAAKKTIESGNYVIASSLNTSKVIDVEGDVITNNTNIDLWSNNGGNNQKFIITYLNDGYYTLRVFSSNKVLTVKNSSYLSGANVVQAFYNGGDAQKWAILEDSSGTYFIVNKLNGLVLDIQGATTQNGANIEVYEKNNGGNQKFKFIKTSFSATIQNRKYAILAASNNKKAIDVEWASTENGGNIDLWDSNGGSNQSFYFEYVGDGYYTIEAACSRKLLTVKDGNVIQQEANNTDSQKWVIQKADSNGIYSIRSKANNYYLEIYNNSMANRTNIRVCSGNDQNSQKFKLEELIYIGIDVSKYNGNINWKQVAYSGLDFSIIRIGLRGYESGKIVFDEKFKENAVNASANGLKVGAYFVTQAKNYSEGKEEASQVLVKLKEYNVNLTYPIVVDIEWAGGDRGYNGRADYISVDDRTEAARGFCETIKNAGYTPVIYANKEWLMFYLNMSKLSAYDVWLAHYVAGAPDKKSDYTGKYTMWQYTSSGSIQGINGNVDIDICYKKYN